MTIPAKGWLVLRRATDKRLPQHSVERERDGFGVQTQPFSQIVRTALKSDKNVGRMASSEAANGKCRLIVVMCGLAFASKAGRERRATGTAQVRASRESPIGEMFARHAKHEGVKRCTSGM